MTNVSDPVLDDLLNLAVQEGASDLHLSVGSAPLMRLDGHLAPADLPPLEPADTERYMHAIATPEQYEQVREAGGVDFCFSFGSQARFRTSIFLQRGNVGIVLRQIPSTLLSLEKMGLPPQINDLIMKPRGLILVTGPTGSGKSTTLASMIDIINQRRNGHIITVEDPIEYYHKSRKCVVTQREVGTDVPTFSEAIRRGLRQDPDVILIGEMRDLETMEAAVTAAETGHLVFSTLHTTGAAASLDRIIDAFPTEQQEQVRTQLSASVVAIISQQLMTRVDQPGRVAAFEFMVATASIRNLIREKKTFRINSDMQTGARLGMITMDDSLYNLYARKVISYEDAINKSQDTEALTLRIEEAKRNR